MRRGGPEPPSPRAVSWATGILVSAGAGVLLLLGIAAAEAGTLGYIVLGLVIALTLMWAFTTLANHQLAKEKLEWEEWSAERLRRPRPPAPAPMPGCGPVHRFPVYAGGLRPHDRPPEAWDLPQSAQDQHRPDTDPPDSPPPPKAA